MEKYQSQFSNHINNTKIMLIDFFAINTFKHKTKYLGVYKQKYGSDFWNYFFDTVLPKNEKIDAILIFGKGGNTNNVKQSFEKQKVIFLQTNSFPITLFNFLKENSNNYHYYLLSEDITIIDVFVLLKARFYLDFNLTFINLNSFTAEYINYNLYKIITKNYKTINLPLTRDNRTYIMKFRRDSNDLVKILKRYKQERGQGKKIYLGYDWLFKNKFFKVFGNKYSKCFLRQWDLIEKNEIIYPITFRKFKEGYKEPIDVLTNLFKMCYGRKNVVAVKDIL